MAFHDDRLRCADTAAAVGGVRPEKADKACLLSASSGTAQPAAA